MNQKNNNYFYLAAILLPILVFYILLREMGGTLMATLLISLTILYTFLVFSFFVIEKVYKKRLDGVKLIVIVAFALVISLSIFISAVIIRHKFGDPLIHDGALMTEIAAEMVTEGKNPYTESYYGTSLASWGEYDGMIVVNGQLVENPALDHYIYLPLNFLIITPFQELTKYFNLFFDYRYLLYMFWFLAFLSLFAILRKNQHRVIAGVLFLLNPLMIDGVSVGMNDILMVAFLVFTFLFLFKKKYLLATAMVALACVFKQTIWFFLPLYLAWLGFQLRDEQRLKKDWYKHAIVFFVVFVLIVGPFLIWDAGSFLDDVFLYPIGATEQIYPINGYSLASLMNIFGSVGLFDKLPYLSIVQIIICLPLLILFLFFIKKNRSKSLLITLYALWLIIYWFFSRFFNPNYIAYIVSLLMLGYFWYLKEEEIKAKLPVKK